MSATIRLRTPGDIQQCARRLIEVHELDGYPVEGVAEPEAWLSPPGLVRSWVGELDGSIIGHVLVATPGPSDDAAALWTNQSQDRESNILVLARLFVGPAGRNHGVGEKLTRAVMAEAAECSVRLVLDVMEKDRAAIRLYERLGWQNIGATRHRFGDGRETAAQCYVAPH
jgi:ribosomal protein S18 acetylase RimI-like enzyme